MIEFMLVLLYFYIGARLLASVGGGSRLGSSIFLLFWPMVVIVGIFLIIFEKEEKDE